jgi:putative redox protein
VSRLEVGLVATRRDAEPRRVLAVSFAWTVAGAGADQDKARRAIDLSLEKYCSVMASLAPDIAVTYDVTIA